MKLKKFSLSIIIAIIILTINFSPITYAASSDWVQDAFDAANSFLKDKEVEDNLGGVIGTLLTEFKNIIKGLNIVLLVLLTALSAVALAVVGVTYIMAGDSPGNKENAKKSLHTVFIGMVYGFGAYVIWSFSMGIVNLIIQAFAQG